MRPAVLTYNSFTIQVFRVNASFPDFFTKATTRAEDARRHFLGIFFLQRRRVQRRRGAAVRRMPLPDVAIDGEAEEDPHSRGGSRLPRIASRCSRHRADPAQRAEEAAAKRRRRAEDPEYAQRENARDRERKRTVRRAVAPSQPRLQSRPSPREQTSPWEAQVSFGNACRVCGRLWFDANRSARCPTLRSAL